MSTVLELKNYLEMLCYEGKQHAMVKFVASPYESEAMYVEPFSCSDDTVTLTNRDRAQSGLIGN